MARGKIFLGLMAGIAVGSLIGILFAPDSGISTRKKIVDKGEDYADKVKEKFNGLIHGKNGSHERAAETVSAVI
jgi:gas vesicle protein